MISVTKTFPAIWMALTLAAFGPPTATPRTASSGDLVKNIDAYSGDELASLVSRLPYGQGADRARACRGTAECANGQRTSVRIDAVADADSLGPGSAGAFGTIVARVMVRGQGVESRYGMQGGGQHIYALVVMPGGTTWRLEELDRQGPRWSHRAIASGRVTGCNHPFVRGGRADFRTCAQGSGGTSFSFASNVQGFEAPMWFSCASGCCTADQ